MEAVQTRQYISENQRKIMGFILDYFGRFGYAPTRIEIAENTGMILATAQYHIYRLVKLGFLKIKSKHGTRNIEVIHS